MLPNEYYQFVTTGGYLPEIPHSPKPPVIQKRPEELGKKKDSDAEKSADDKCNPKIKKEDITSKA